MMNRLPKSQTRLIAILICVILGVVMLLLALINISLFFVALVLLAVGLALLRMKKPEVFSLFGKQDKSGAGGGKKPAAMPDSPFNAHIVLLYHSGMSMQQVTVDKAEFSIGRNADCDFVLSGNTNISRLHAFIRYDAVNGRSTVTDNHSSHGTKLNGEQLPPDTPRPLRNGDIIQIEDRILTVQSKNY